MSDLAATVGFLVDGDRSPEQHAALEWCAEAGIDADTVSLATVATDGTVPSGYDALWWHRAEPVADAAALPDASEPIRTYVEEGGGLLLTLRALEAVPTLDIDPVGPDVSSLEEPTTTTGLLWKSLYDDHPAVDGLEGLRIRTRAPEGVQPSTRYERVLPERGTVLASTLHEDREAPHEVALVGWRVGTGDVAGLGTGIQFDGPASDAAAQNRTRLLSNLLAVLGDGERRLLEREPRSVESLRSNREKLVGDHHRPQYHLSPPGDWLNDPNGLIKWNGTYHAFYQYNPGGPYHGTIHWGHAVSDDLVTWEDRPIALTPSPDGPDRDGCWSGCAMAVDGTPTIMYTGGRDDVQLPCLGTATDDDLNGWEKSAENPVINTIPVEPPLRSTEHWRAEFRDHNIWYQDGTWHHLIGSGVEDGGGTALLYTADDDMTNWTYHGPILVGDPDRDGEMWECPELLDLGEKQLLHISNYEEVRYYLGEYEDGSFDVERDGLLDHGVYYAPQSLRDDDDRWLTWGWVKPDRSPAAQWDAGWSGTLSLPRQVDLDTDGKLRQRPAPELTELRESHAYGGEAVLEDERQRLPVDSRSFELRAEIQLDDASEFGLTVRESPDSEEETLIRYTRESDVVVDRSASTTDPRASDTPVSMPVTPVDGALSLRVFVDGSVVELFANERHCLTTRIFPTREDSDGISIYAADGTAVVDELDVWQMGSAWPTAQAEAERTVQQ
ncbi:sucrose-6-phosphate hydrolase [Natronococcus pandeyae]|uniref:beta-fructofuranosidase n=1 Tax=Natronococcus pandeyae TaxID=2055836 RepID=A0A8J8Q3W8_9EURY|nr:GH32 C-terminal domain-containing protein [Natronococcus pandeyae]TYL38762.1 sucrose-6-phosphate hydrolase [Natronococcus pandeyae]